MARSLEVRFPDGQTQTYELTRERTVVGRSPQADIRINDSRVSREHCAIEVRGDKVYVVDLGGSNGTWIGRTKILPNLQEPFPEEEAVFVGPAQLRLVPEASGFDPTRDLESQAFRPVAPSRSPRPSERAPARAPTVSDVPQAYEAPPVPRGTSMASLELTNRRVTVNPGERANLRLTVTNQSKIVDHYTLSVVGAPTTWLTLPRSGVELMPRQSGDLAIDFHPPKDARTSSGTHPLSIAVLNRDGQVVSETTADLEIGSYENLILDIRPNPYEGRSGGAMVLTVENHGNAETQYRVDALDPTDSVDIYVEPQTASVAPQQSRENYIHISPRKRNWIGDAKRRNLSVTVTGNQQSTTVNPVYVQLSTIPRWAPILLLLACCVLVPLFGFMAWDSFNVYLTPTPSVTPTPENTATPTPDLPATLTATREMWLDMDDDGDGLTNRQELEYGTLPDEVDSDGDGLSDFDEIFRYGTDPNNPDTDGDGLSDWVEVQPGSCTSPTNPDTDGDGINDGADPEPCSGPTPTATPRGNFALGGHIASHDNLDVVQKASMTWVKVQLRYGVGDNPQSAAQDAIKLKEQGLKVLLSVVGSKEDLERGGTGYYQAFAEFLGGLATVADGIEVWNEPNIQNEWPVGQIDPNAYTQMLRVAHQAIKAKNRQTIVISAAPAPTGVNNPTVMSDDRFIAGMAAAGARQYMDCIGIHFNAGATSPNQRTGHPADSNGHYSWYFWPIVELYFNTFNPEGTVDTIPLCFTEIGYVTDAGFSRTLAQVGAHNFGWASAISISDQAAWLAEALVHSCESSMVRLFIVWNVDFTNYGEDPQAGYAILRPDKSCPSCTALTAAVGQLRTRGCMN
jgi:hypothetical protein